MGKWNARINWAIVVLLFISAVSSFWVSIEKQKLNQRYERMIERYEAELNSLNDLNQDIRLMADLLKKSAVHQGN